MLFIKEIYVRRLELENIIYRRHMSDLEQALRLSAVKELRSMLNEVVKSTPSGSKGIKSLKASPLPKVSESAVSKRKGEDMIKDSPTKKVRHQVHSGPSESHKGSELRKGEVVDLTEDFNRDDNHEA